MTEPTPDPAVPTGYAGRIRSAVLRNRSRVTAVYFAAIVSVPLILFLAGARPASVENTTPASRPDLAVRDVMNTEMYADIADWFEDRLPGRDRAIEANAWIEFRVFGTSPNPRVQRGSDGWLFLRDGVEAECLDRERIDAAVAEMELIDTALDLTGRRFIVLVAPNKEAIYPEHLGGLAEKTECSNANRSAFLDGIEKSGAVEILDTWAILEEAKSGGQVYHRFDTHWNRLGTAAIAEALLEVLEPGIWDPSALVLEGHIDRESDLVRMMGLPIVEQEPRWTVIRGDGFTISTEQLSRGANVVVSRASESPSVDQAGLMIHDSMGAVLSPHLRPYFDEWVTVKAPGGPRTFGASGAWFDDLLRSSDVFVAQAVERSLFARFNGELASTVIGAVAAELPHYEVQLTRRLTGEDLDTRWSVARQEIVTAGRNPMVEFELPSPATGGQFLVIEISPARVMHVRMSWAGPGESLDAADSVRTRVPRTATTAVFDLSVIGDATRLRLGFESGRDHRLSSIKVVDLGLR